MLSTMRKGVSTIFAKALMLLLVLSFALWGVGDMLRSNGNTHVARVGDAKISPNEFEERMARIKNQMQGMPEEMLNSEMMKTQILQGMVQQLLLLQEASSIGMKVDNTTIAKVIRENPQFQNANGTFDAATFRAFLSSNRISEAGFVETIRRDVESATVLQTLDIPETIEFSSLSHSLDAAKRQSRTADIYVIAPVNVEVAPPDDKALEDFYQTIQADYMQPETRSIAYVAIPATSIDAYTANDVNETKIEDRYAIEKEHMGTPEKRDLLQFLFKDGDKAKLAADALRKGESTENVAATYPLQNGEALIMRGVSKSALPAEAADAVFALDDGDVSAPVQTEFGWHVFKVTGITKGTTPSLDKARDSIRAMLIEEERENTLFTIAGKIEDAMAAGDSVDKAVKSLGIQATSKTIEATSKQVPEGDATSVEPYAIKTGFSLGEGEFSGFQKVGNVFVAVTALSIAEQEPKALADVKLEVGRRYVESERVRASAERAAAIATTLRSSQDPQSVAAKERIQRRSFGPITLGQALESQKPVNGIPVELMRRMFDIDLGEMTTPVRMADGSWALAKITKVTQSADVTANNSAPSKELTPILNNTVYANYLKFLTTRYPVTVNDALLKDANAQP